MAGFSVTDDQRRVIDRRMGEIKRQLNQADGSPLDPKRVMDVQQAIVEGEFDNGHTSQELATKLWERISDTAIRVYSAHPVKLPFGGTKPELLNKSNDLPESWLVELRDRELCVDGQRVEFFLSESQKTGTVRGYDLDKQLKGQPVLHPNILDALLENTHLIPEPWMQDEQGHTRYIYFWAVRFLDSVGDLYVRYLHWDDGLWRWCCRWLGYRWDDQLPAAVLAS